MELEEAIEELESLSPSETAIETVLTALKESIPKNVVKNKVEYFNDRANRIAGTYQYADSDEDLEEKKAKVIKYREFAEILQDLLKGGLKC